MARIVAVTAVLPAILFAAVAAAAADRVQPGQWETTMILSSGKPMVTKYCITPGEARSMSGDEATLRKYLAESTSESTKGRCNLKSVTLKNDQIRVAIVCGAIEVVTTTTYGGDRYESSSSNGAKVEGKRLGACP
jgi:hypothetical protein